MVTITVVRERQNHGWMKRSYVTRDEIQQQYDNIYIFFILPVEVHSYYYITVNIYGQLRLESQ